MPRTLRDIQKQAESQASQKGHQIKDWVVMHKEGRYYRWMGYCRNYCGFTCNVTADPGSAEPVRGPAITDQCQPDRLRTERGATYIHHKEA